MLFSYRYCSALISFYKKFHKNVFRLFCVWIVFTYLVINWLVVKILLSFRKKHTIFYVFMKILYFFQPYTEKNSFNIDFTVFNKKNTTQKLICAPIFDILIVFCRVTWLNNCFAVHFNSLYATFYSSFEAVVCCWMDLNCQSRYGNIKFVCMKYIVCLFFLLIYQIQLTYDNSGSSIDIGPMLILFN